MAIQLVEFFGYRPLDPVGQEFAAELQCPFVGAKCIKPKHGACSLAQTNLEPVITCPNRLYDENFSVLADVATQAFGEGVRLTPAAEIASLKLEGALTGLEVAVFGKYWGRELSIPKPKVEDGDDTGGFYIDFVLARLDTIGNMAEFTAVEVQTIDSTGSYKAQSEAFFAGANFNSDGANSQGWSKKAGLNWANVSKRILPQLIYKGYVLRRERLCGKGLFFICPTAVLKRVRARLGTKMLEYPIAAGTITFQAYDLSEQAYDQTGMPVAGQRRTLIKGETFTTTVEQVAFAFVSPVNLPEMGVYENAIASALKKKAKKEGGLAV